MTVEYQKIDIKRKQEKREWLTVAVPQSHCHSSVLVDAPLGWYCRLECSLQSYHWSEYAQTLKRTKKLSQYWFGVRSMDRLQGEIFPQPACLWKVEGALWGAITIPLNSSPHKHFGTNGLQVYLTAWLETVSAGFTSRPLKYPHYGPLGSSAHKTHCHNSQIYNFPDIRSFPFRILSINKKPGNVCLDTMCKPSQVPHNLEMGQVVQLKGTFHPSKQGR